MSAIMEINIPVYASEVILKTAGKYCDKDIRVRDLSGFRIESGTKRTITNAKAANTSMGIALSEQPKVLFIKAKYATAKKIYDYAAGRTTEDDQKKPYSFGAIINMLHDMDVAGYQEASAYNSVVFSYQWYDNEGTSEAAQVLKATKPTYTANTNGTGGVLSFRIPYVFDTFDDGTTAEYEWTAYYWNK